MKKEVKTTDDITLELEKLANETPSRFYLMKITDEETGLTINVDQSLDSTIKSAGKHIAKLMEEFVKIHLYWKDRPYNGEFDGKHVVRINTLLIDFGEIEGKTAHKWLLRYVKVVLNMADKEGNLDLKDIEQRFKGKCV